MKQFVLLFSVGIMSSVCFAGRFAEVKLCAFGRDYVFELEFLEKVGEKPLPRGCDRLTVLKTFTEYNESRSIFVGAPENLLNALGRKFNESSYDYQTMKFDTSVQFEAYHLRCLGMERKVLVVSAYKSGPSYPDYSSDSLFGKTCFKTEPLYFKSNTVIQGVYTLADGIQGREFLISKMGIQSKDFVLNPFHFKFIAR